MWLMVIILIIFGHMLPLEFPSLKKKKSMFYENCICLVSYMSTEGKGSRD